MLGRMLFTTFPLWLDVSYFLDIHSFYLYYLLSILSSTVPVNKLPEKDGSQRFYQEKISYEHQYNSRWQKNYPIRSTVSVQFIQSHALLFINLCLIQLIHHSNELPKKGKFIDHRDVYQFWIGRAKTHS